MEEELQVWKQMSEDPDNWPYYISRHKFLMDQISWQRGMERTEAARREAELAQALAEAGRAEAEEGRAKAEEARTKAEDALAESRGEVEIARDKAEATRAEMQSQYRDVVKQTADLDRQVRQLQSDMTLHPNRMEEIIGILDRNRSILREYARMLIDQGATSAEVLDHTGLSDVNRSG